MGQYSFRSSGLTGADRESQALVKTSSPIGIKTPLKPGNNTLFAVNYDLADQIADNLRNLILTNWGERVCLYDFGANLRPILTEYVSQSDFDAEAINRIASAVQKWMPYVVLEDYVSTTDRLENKNTAIVKLTITYTIPSLGQSTKKSIEIILYVI